MKKLEIYGTLGPSCCETNTIKALFQEGMNGMRLNLSHCNLWDKKEWIDNFHKAAKEVGITPFLLIDMKGPELRIKKLKDPIVLKKEQTIVFNNEILPEAILQHAQTNDLLLMDDGLLRVKVKENDHKVITGIVLNEGILKGNKSIAIEGKSISGNVLTENDIENLKVAKEYGVTGIMQPFVRSAQDLITLQTTLHSLQIDVKIYAKIENIEGFENIESLLPYCDHIIIARGDLGNATGLSKLPVVQHKIESLCKKHNKPYMVVTQMLHSMHEHAIPTRAEVSDIFHAVYNGASSIMLTGETASGKYPVEAMHYFVECAKEALIYKGE